MMAIVTQGTQEEQKKAFCYYLNGILQAVRDDKVLEAVIDEAIDPPIMSPDCQTEVARGFMRTITIRLKLSQ